MTDIEYQPESFVTFMDDDYSTPPVTTEIDFDGVCGIIKVSQLVDYDNPSKGRDFVYFDAEGFRDFAERVLAVLDEQSEADSFTDSLDLNYNTNGTPDYF